MMRTYWFVGLFLIFSWSLIVNLYFTVEHLNRKSIHKNCNLPNLQLTKIVNTSVEQINNRVNIQSVNDPADQLLHANTIRSGDRAPDKENGATKVQSETLSTVSSGKTEINKDVTSNHPAIEEHHVPAKYLGSHMPCIIRLFLDNIPERIPTFVPWIMQLASKFDARIRLYETADLSAELLDSVLLRWNGTDTAKECILDFLMVSRPRVESDEGAAVVQEVIQAGLSARKSVTLNNRTPVSKLSTSGTWHNAVLWNPKATIFSFVNNRPVLVGDTPEAFANLPPKKISSQVDIMISRVKKSAGKTLTGHIVQGVNLGFRKPLGQVNSLNIRMHPSWDLNNLVQDPKSKGTMESFYWRLLERKTGFAAIMNQRIMRRSVYRMDAVVRFAICDILSDYKPCHSISRAKNYLQNATITAGHLPCQYPQFYGLSELNWDLAGFPCYSPYKFALSMENTAIDGYVSEKLFNAKFAHTIPVYFGAPNIAEYVNPKALVICSLSPKELKSLREHLDPSGEYQSLLSKEQVASGVQKASDEQLVKYVRKLVETSLQPCIREIQHLDSDDKAYIAKLKQPLFIDNKYRGTYLDGSALAEGVKEMLRIGRLDQRFFEKNRTAIAVEG